MGPGGGAARPVALTETSETGAEMPALLNFLHREEEFQVIWFHDSFGVIDDLLRAVDRRSYLIFSFSWYADVGGRLEKLFNAFSGAIAKAASPHIIPEQILFLMNSRAELHIAERLGARFRLAFVNNTCFLDPNLYTVMSDAPKIFDAVCNAKALAFKRHELTRKVGNKCFITYDSKELDYGMTAKVDLHRLDAAEIFADIEPRKVVEVLNRCYVGLILSAEEGACYASTEYLLCGLPVVSTGCRGGRTEFYDSENSIEVPPEPDAVRDAVIALREDVRGGRLRPDEIRDGAVDRLRQFRTSFLDALEDLLRGENAAAAIRQKVENLMEKHSKMVPYRNWFKTGVSSEAEQLVCTG